MSEQRVSRSVSCRIARLLVCTLWHSFAVFGIVVAAYWACFDVSRITSESMSPTLEGTSWNNGDLVLTEKISFWFRTPRRWEVIAVRTPDNTLIMKRVVGLPGETVQILRRGKIVIDGVELKRPTSLSFLNHLPFGNVTGGRKVQCGRGYYVLGDFSEDSDDSRFNGPIHTPDIVGRVWLILAPSERRGKVN